MRHWLICGLLVFCGACSGDAGGPPTPNPDTSVFLFDQSVLPLDQQLTPNDQSTTPNEGGADAPKACASWSEWSCKEERDLLCSATCGTALISCTNGGVCQCGVVSTGPCEGVFSGSSPCEVCQNALAGGCCAP